MFPGSKNPVTIDDLLYEDRVQLCKDVMKAKIFIQKNSVDNTIQLFSKILTTSYGKNINENEKDVQHMENKLINVDVTWNLSNKAISVKVFPCSISVGTKLYISTNFISTERFFIYNDVEEDMKIIGLVELGLDVVVSLQSEIENYFFEQYYRLRK